jgi:hypothetical protein
MKRGLLEKKIIFWTCKIWSLLLFSRSPFLGGFMEFFFRFLNRVKLRVFKGDNRPFKVVLTILETLDMEPHGNDQKKQF